MINIHQMFKASTAVLNKNAPAILTAFGAVGVVGTAVLTAKATFEASDKIREETIQRNLAVTTHAEVVELTTSEKVKLVWPLYISAVSSGVLSCGAIVMSHRISSRRAAMLAAAYALNESKLEEYQDKIKEKFGIKKEAEARNELHQDRINREYDENEVIFSPLDGKVLVMEEYTGRFFWSSIDAIEKAVNEVNALVLKEGSVRMSDFYETIGLKPVSTSDYFGWTREDMLELSWDTGTTPDGKTPVHTFEYVNHPVMNPEREANPFR